MAIGRIIRKNRIEEQIIPFLNLVENFSKTDDDIVNVLDRTNQYLNEPLKSIINNFVMDARLYANLDSSFEKMYRAVEGTKLVEIFKSLQICSRHDSDYSRVVQDAKISMKEYLKSQAVQKAIINSARIDLGALFMGGIIICNILDSFLSKKVIMILLSSYIGIGILVYCIIIVCISIYYLFWRHV